MLNIVRLKNTIATFLAILAVAVGVPEGYASQGVVTAHAQRSAQDRIGSSGASEECGSCRNIGVPRRRPNSCRGCLASKPAPQRNCLRSGCRLHRPIDQEPSFAHQARRRRPFRSRHHSYAALRSPSEPTLLRGRVRRRVFNVAGLLS